MTLRIIPIVPGNRASTRRVQLDGREYVLDLRWSDFEGCFYLTLKSAAAAVLVAGVRVVSNEPLLEGWHGSSSVPAGELVALDTRLSPADPSLDEFGDIVRLGYVEGAARTGAASSASSTGSGSGGDPL